MRAIGDALHKVDAARPPKDRLLIGVLLRRRVLRVEHQLTVLDQQVRLRWQHDLVAQMQCAVIDRAELV